MRLPDLAELEAAAALVGRHVRPTPACCWPLLDEAAGCEVWVKHENHTPVGAFKVRGGLVFLARLRQTTPGLRGVVCATRGNHGQSVAFAARQHGVRVRIVAPHGNSAEKNAAMAALGAELTEYGHDFQAAFEHAQCLAAETGWPLAPSFHPWLVEGVGSYALELFRAAPPLDVVYVPIGLGSGICGVLAAKAALGLQTRVIGVVSSGAPAFALSFLEGQPVSHPVSTRIADGLACRAVNPDALRLIRQGVERIVRVTDDEIEAAMRTLFSATHNTAEGAGAASLAALLQDRPHAPGVRAAIVLSGANVDAATFARVLQGP